MLKALIVIITLLVAVLTDNLLLPSVLISGLAIGYLFGKKYKAPLTQQKSEVTQNESDQSSTEIINAITSGLFIFQYKENDQLILIYGNPEAENIVGWNVKGMIGKEFNTIWPKAKETGITDSFLNVIRTGEYYETEDLYYKDHKAEGIFRLKAFKLSKQQLGVTFENIIAQKRTKKERDHLEAQLRQSQKMEAIGTLAGGIAHDFNNILQTITGFAEYMQMDKEADEPDYKNLNEIITSADRAKELIRQLMFFSRKAETKKAPWKINFEIEQAMRLLDKTIPKMVKFETHLDKGIWDVNVDPVQMEQMILNLCSNASDAMPGGGKIIIKTENAVIDENFTKLNAGSLRGDYVLLSIEDTGQGIDEKNINKIYEPFFTTKKVGQGTGLGLASVYGITKNHNGYITCESKLDQGTKFKIYLPALKHSTEVIKKEKVEIQKGTETILVVDDEQSIRKMASDTLKRFGYQVLLSSSGEEAIDLYKEANFGIDLVLLDINMPGMGGFECYKKLKKLDSNAIVVIASGYLDQDEVQENLGAGVAGYIHKPYKLTELLNTIREFLNYPDMSDKTMNQKQESKTNAI